MGIVSTRDVMMTNATSAMTTGTRVIRTDHLAKLYKTPAKTAPTTTAIPKNTCKF